ncbi:peroxidase family protein [Phytohabitans rumicis]|uniref:Ovoperoxidase n=1 Tax=Phytohabitans rumicis TaxID=1076125 RepID=A0A6V8LJE7_9ACTN|nr:heme peroxidase family protein [Phytohabitans rumicis]GFJ94988.1 ovoperoxidase [Phytohabitans rumicis]
MGATAAGAVAIGAAPAAIGAHEAYAATPADRFGRMFPDLPPFIPADDRRRAALIDIGKPGGILDAKDPLAEGPVRLITNPELSPNNRDNSDGTTIHMTAGVTFFGQFLDHDMTFDTASPLGIPTTPESSPNSRTPSFDLDTVYGGGPVASPALYESDRVKLRIESNGLFEDLPRSSNGTAIIGDPRNDENAIIAGFQSAFILAHNRIVDELRAQGVPAAQQFAQARRTLTWHYHWIILKEFLPTIVGQSMVNTILSGGRRWFRPDPNPAFIPVEFQIAYRFGHSMIRPSYRLNLAGNADGTPFFGFIFDPAGEGQADPVDLRGGARARRRFVGWQTFFDFGGAQTTHVRPNKRIDTKISTPLFHLPLGAIASGDPPTSLATRNLLRTLTWGVPAGQRIAQNMGNPMLHLQELADYGVALENQTPLWYYVLAEAERLANGVTLGPTGGRIIGEVFIGLLQLDPNGYLRVQPGWTPTLPAVTPGTFKMTDLLRWARVDPASRGQ